MIWGWTGGCAVHESLLAEYEQEGFTGYRTKPATILFRDGQESNEYREFIVTGWAGVASRESGVQLLEECPGCFRRQYSAIKDYDRLIDWDQWTGEDFFIVWPMPRFALVTKRVSAWLKRRKVKSFSLSRLEDIPDIVANLGFTVVSLSESIPEDLAIKYGGPLGLE